LKNKTDYFLFSNVGLDFGYIVVNESKPIGEENENEKYYDAYDDDDDHDRENDNPKPNIFHRMCCML